MKTIRGISGALIGFFGLVLRIVVGTGGYIEFNNKRIYGFSTAVTAGDATTAPAGAIAVTTHATGRRQIFVSDGANWQDYYGQATSTFSIATIATTSATNAFWAAPVTGKLIAAIFIGSDALAASDTNYLTFALTNLGQNGAGNTALLAATDPNTTKATGGSALAANTNRSLTVHGTAGNLSVTRGDRLRFTATATGTLGNTVTNGTVILVFQRTI